MTIAVITPWAVVTLLAVVALCTVIALLAVAVRGAGWAVRLATACGPVAVLAVGSGPLAPVIPIVTAFTPIAVVAAFTAIITIAATAIAKITAITPVLPVLPIGFVLSVGPFWAAGQHVICTGFSRGAHQQCSAFAVTLRTGGKIHRKGIARGQGFGIFQQQYTLARAGVTRPARKAGNHKGSGKHAGGYGIARWRLGFWQGSKQQGRKAQPAFAKARSQ